MIQDREALWDDLRSALGDPPPSGGVVDVAVPAGRPELRLSLRHEPGWRSQHLWTRLVSHVPARYGFRGGAYPEPWYEELAEVFGLQDVHTGNSKFDRHFRVGADDEARARALFGDEEVRRRMMEEPEVHVSLSSEHQWPLPHVPGGAWELVTETPWSPDHVGHVRGLFDLHMALRERLGA